MSNTSKRILIRNYEPGDEAAVIDLWNRCLSRDPINARVFRNKVLLDPNFNPAGCRVALSGDRPVGFLLAIVRKVPMEGIGLQPETGWITCFFVDEEYRRCGIGSAMLSEAIEFFRSHGRKEAWVSPYTPNYFFPGVDVEEYPEAIELLKKHGFEEDHRVVGMSRKLLDLRVPAEVAGALSRLEAGGITITTFEPRYLLRLMKFLEQNFPGDWARAARDKLLRGLEDEITIALAGDDVIGYCQHEAERFGPFGVSPDYRGKNIGAALFYRTAERMKAKGLKHMWLAWTHGAAQRFYEAQGLSVDRTHAIMRLALAAADGKGARNGGKSESP